LKEIHIVSSSDNGLVPHIFTQLKNISINFAGKHIVHYWLFHYRIEKKSIDAFAAYADFLGINFHEIFLENHKDYEVLNKGTDGKFPVEAYFYYEAHKYLPGNVDRALMIDAGDVIFDGDIDEFYFAPFEGNFIHTSMAFMSPECVFNWDHLKNPSAAKLIQAEYINSGVIMLNFELMRIFNINLKFYENVADYLIRTCEKFTTLFYPVPIYYSYDQGLLAAAFLGRIKFFDYDKYGYITIHMPYNFRPLVLEGYKNQLDLDEDGNIDLPYTPRIIHLIGHKPWKIDDEKLKTLLPISQQCIKLFWEYEKAAKSDIQKLKISI
jgi:hypothetical protein